LPNKNSPLIFWIVLFWGMINGNRSFSGCYFKLGWEVSGMLFMSDNQLSDNEKTIVRSLRGWNLSFPRSSVVKAYSHVEMSPHPDHPSNLAPVPLAPHYVL
jgi:hypothetical protein